MMRAFRISYRRRHRSDGTAETKKSQKGDAGFSLLRDHGKKSVPAARHRSLLFCFCLGMDTAIPLARAAEAFLETHVRVIAEDFARLCDVRLRIANVTIARRIVLGFEPFP